MAYMGTINLATACNLYQQAIGLFNFCNLENGNWLLSLMKNTLLTKGSWLSEWLGFHLIHPNPDLEVIGIMELVKILIIVQVYFFEIILTTAINLDFITTVINSFNRKQNIKNISRLSLIMAFYCFIVSFGILVNLIMTATRGNEKETKEIRRIGIEQGFGLN